MPHNASRTYRTTGKTCKCQNNLFSEPTFGPEAKEHNIANIVHKPRENQKTNIYKTDWRPSRYNKPFSMHWCHSPVTNLLMLWIGTTISSLVKLRKTFFGDFLTDLSISISLPWSRWEQISGIPRNIHVGIRLSPNLKNFVFILEGLAIKRKSQTNLINRFDQKISPIVELYLMGVSANKYID